MPLSYKFNNLRGDRGGRSYPLAYKLNKIIAHFYLPETKPKDNLIFAKQFAKIYEKLNISSKLQVIAGGSDSNIFAKQGFNSIIIGVGMNNVHTVEEYSEIDELVKTTEAIVRYIKKD